MALEVTVEELQWYARCSLAWWWEKRLKLEKPTALCELAPAALRQALAFYAQGHTVDLEAAVVLVWRDWCESWGAAEAWDDLYRFAAGRAEILTTRTPAHSKAYRQRMQAAGLTQLAGRLNALAHAQGLLAPEANGQATLADVCADSLQWANRMQPSLPAPSQILGWQVPYHLKFGEGLRVTGQADLLTRADSADSVIVEVHAFDGPAPVRAEAVAHALKVLAAALAEPTISGGSLPQWKTVQHVVYRHWPSGQTLTRRELNVGYFHAVVTALTRGMANEVIVPRALTNAHECATCGFYAECFGPNQWAALPLLDATLHARANTVRDVVRRVRSAVGADSEAARRTQRALEQVQAALAEQPDALAVQTILAEAHHALNLYQPPSP